MIWANDPGWVGASSRGQPDHALFLACLIVCGFFVTLARSTLQKRP